MQVLRQVKAKVVRVLAVEDRQDLCQYEIRKGRASRVQPQTPLRAAMVLGRKGLGAAAAVLFALPHM